MASVKGTAVDASLRYVRERFGEGALASALAALPEPDRAALGQGVLASSWYPMDALLGFMQEAERQLGPREPDLVRRMGRASSEYSLKGIYKISFKVGSPEFIIARAGWMERTLELSGARGVRLAHPACVHRGDAVCRFGASWD